MRSRIAEANAAVEDEVDTYSDDEDEELDDDENLEEVDTSSRLNQPLSYNRSLMELYRTPLFIRL
jgi:hypothetical protein